MIDVKEAARIAFAYMQELYKPEEIPRLTLEEVELSPDEGFWLVTVSFLKTEAMSPIEAMTGQHGAPTYKILKVHAETGQVQSMKVRTMGPR
jgi:hypothetical protein